MCFSLIRDYGICFKHFHEKDWVIGDTIYVETKILEKRESKGKKDRCIVYVETRVVNQNQDIVLTFRRHVLVPKGNK